MKIEAKQINEWVKRAYDNAVKHGWHEEEKSNAHWLMMVCTEVAEAVQADRKGNYMDDLDKEGLKTVLPTTMVAVCSINTTLIPSREK